MGVSGGIRNFADNELFMAMSDEELELFLKTSDAISSGKWLSDAERDGVVRVFDGVVSRLKGIGVEVSAEMREARDEVLAGMFAFLEDARAGAADIGKTTAHDAPIWSSLLAVDSSFVHDPESGRFRMGEAPVFAFGKIGDPKNILGAEFSGAVHEYEKLKNAEAGKYSPHDEQSKRPSWSDMVTIYIQRTKRKLAADFPELAEGTHPEVVAAMKKKLDEEKAVLSSKKSGGAASPEDIEKTGSSVREKMERLKTLTSLLAGLHRTEQALDGFLKRIAPPVSMKDGFPTGPLVEAVEKTVNDIWGTANSPLRLRIGMRECIGELRNGMEKAIAERKPLNADVLRKASSMLTHCPLKNIREEGLMAVRNMFDIVRNPRFAEHLLEYGYEYRSPEGSVSVRNEQSLLRTLKKKGGSAEFAFEKYKEREERLVRDTYLLLLMFRGIPGLDGDSATMKNIVLEMNSSAFIKSPEYGVNICSQFANKANPLDSAEPLLSINEKVSKLMNHLSWSIDGMRFGKNPSECGASLFRTIDVLESRLGSSADESAVRKIESELEEIRRRVAHIGPYMVSQTISDAEIAKFEKYCSSGAEKIDYIKKMVKVSVELKKRMYELGVRIGERLTAADFRKEDGCEETDVETNEQSM